MSQTPNANDDLGTTAERAGAPGWGALVARGQPRPSRVFVWACFLAGAAILGVGCADDTASPIKDDEQVLFFPSFGYRGPDSATWVIQIHGKIYEPEEDSALRRGGLARVQKLLGIETKAAESRIFRERAWAFLADGERGKNISIRLGGKRFQMGDSGPDGHFQAVVHLSADDLDELAQGGTAADGWLRFEAITRPDDPRTFSGTVQLTDQTGLSAISDIDDTIKVSEVADRTALVQNTFLRDFEAVSGMAELYQGWAAAGVRFHYVSASPWQLYRPLSAFMRSAGFPSGSFHLKRFSLTVSTVLNLFASPEGLKLAAIQRILTAFPRRQFIFIGDSGQEDPEVYGTVARKYPEQVVRIFIRNVTGEASDSERFRQAFVGVPEEQWTIFDNADAIDSTLP